MRKKRTRLKTNRAIYKALKGKKLYTDLGGICFYKVLKIYEWKEYSANAQNLFGSQWFKFSYAKIKTDYGVVMKIPYIELGLRSVYADSGERVLK